MKFKDFDIVIEGGLCVTEKGREVCDIAVKGDKIADIGKKLASRARTLIPARGKVILPGLVDMHVHFGIPMKNEWSSDDPDSGSRSAIAGGVTLVADFTVPVRGHDPVQTLYDRFAYFSGRSFCDYTFNLTVDTAGSVNTIFMEKASSMGIRTFKVFTCYGDSGLMIRGKDFMRLLEKSDEIGGLILIHAEDEKIILRNRKIFTKNGMIKARYYPASKPPEAELNAVMECVKSAEIVGGNLHFVHVSTGQAAKFISSVRKELKSVTFETCPQYLLLDDTCYEKPDGALFIVSPPLREQSNVEELWELLSRQEIQVISTDHCPFYSVQKIPPAGSLPFYEVPGGLGGVETSFRLLYTFGVLKRKIGLEKIVRIMSENPARILGVYPRKGVLKKDSDADIVIFDPDYEEKLSARSLYTRSDYCVYEGFKIKGRIETVFLRGRRVFHNGKFVSSSPSGIFIPQKPYDCKLIKGL